MLCCPIIARFILLVLVDTNSFFKSSKILLIIDVELLAAAKLQKMETNKGIIYFNLMGYKLKDVCHQWQQVVITSWPAITNGQICD